MGKVKQLQMDIQYILNVLSAHGEQKAVEAFENVRKAIPSEQVPMYGDKINTVGQLKHILRDLDDHDQLCIETIDTETGDTEDLYPMYIDVIDGIRLTNDTIVREVRFCQMDNVEPEVRNCMNSKQHLQSCDDDGFCNNCGHQ